MNLRIANGEIMDPDDEVELMNKIRKWEKSKKCTQHK
jgi:hypothetical protein